MIHLGIIHRAGRVTQAPQKAELPSQSNWGTFWDTEYNILVAKPNKYLAVHHCLFALSWWSFFLTSDLSRDWIVTSVNAEFMLLSPWISPECRAAQAVPGKSQQIMFGEHCRVCRMIFFPFPCSTPLPLAAVRSDRQSWGSSSLWGAHFNISGRFGQVWLGPSMDRAAWASREFAFWDTHLMLDKGGFVGLLRIFQIYFRLVKSTGAHGHFP